MPDSVEIAGSLARPALKLRRMLALSPTWRRVGAGTPRAPEAPEGIWLKSIPDDQPRPLAGISPGAQHNHRLVAGGAGNVLRPEGSLFLYLAIDTPLALYDDPVQAEFYAASFFGSVLDDVALLAGDDDPQSEDGSGHLALIDCQLILFGESPEESWQSAGRFYMATYHIAWGDGGGS